MDQALLVTDQVNRGFRFVKNLNRQGFEIKAAFWLKETAESTWYLYLVTKLVDDFGTRETYRRLVDANTRLSTSSVRRSMPFDLSRVKVIGTTGSLAADVADMLSRNAFGAPILLQGARLGDNSYDEAYIYPEEAFKVR